MSVLQSRGWYAVESTDLTGNNRTLAVTGEVEVSHINEEPVLTEAEPQGINPTILILDLTIKTDIGAGGDATRWKKASYSRPVGRREFHQVDVHGQAVVDVEEILS